MKLLVLGIDGGTADIFDAFDMPFWKSLRHRDVTFPVVEDLNQRGWARMLSGQGADETGGLYMRPFNDQSRRFDFTFNYKMMSQTPGFRPIWRLAEDAGARVGMMNVPTTSPAQPVDGFYVSGGGGGIFQGGLPDNAVYPEEVAGGLNRDGYIFDTRLGAQSFTSIAGLCDHIDKMMTVRQRAFSRLCRQYEVDFGFLAFRATTVLFFLAMSEIAHVMRISPGDPKRRAWSGPWLPLIEAHMRSLDDCLARLFDDLQPEHHIIASDHSIVPWTHNVDFNGFLATHGYARFETSASRVAKNTARYALRRPFRQKMHDVSVRGAPNALRTDNAKLTGAPRAFSGTYVYGIYVNDRDRFGGPVPDGEIGEQTAQIIDDFNWVTLKYQIPMRAEPYRERFADSPKADVLPDVTILQSGHAFPSSGGAHWYARNPNFAPVATVKGVGGMHSGQKGPHPILMTDESLARLKQNDEPNDLRLVHRLTEKLFALKTES